MKKIFLVFILALVYSFSFGQFPSTQTSGTPSTLVKSKGAYGSDSGYVFIHSYPDTTTANYGWLKNIAGIIIRVGNELYMRNSAMTKWNIIGGGNISPNWLLTGNDVVMGQYLGSNNTVPFLLKANDTTVGFISDTLVTFGDVYGTFHDTKIDINDRDSTISLKSNGVVGLGDAAGYGRGTIFTVDDRIRAIKGTTNKFAVGSGVNANGNYSVALGYNTSANGDYSVSIGKQNTVSGVQSMAIGSNLTNSQDSTIKLGFTTSNLSIKAGNNLYNNIGGDSVLTTDVYGNLKLVMGGGSGGSTTLPEAYANGNRFDSNAIINMAGNGGFYVDSATDVGINTGTLNINANGSIISVDGDGAMDILAAPTAFLRIGSQINSNNSVTFGEYNLHNNGAEDSVLITDSIGRVKLKAFSSSSQSLQDVTDIGSTTTNAMTVIKADDNIAFAVNGTDTQTKIDMGNSVDNAGYMNFHNSSDVETIGFDGQSGNITAKNATLNNLASGASTDSIVTVTSALGVVRKRTVSDLIGGSAWGLSGNSITPANFIGTTSNNDLNFRTNNLLKFTIDSTGTPTTVLNLQYYFGVPALYAGATAVNSQFFSLLIQPTNTTISAPNGTVNISNAGVNTTYFGSAYSNFAKPVLLDAGSSGATAPATSAILDVVSTTKGVLLPRMTTTQRDAISSPATGLITYVTDSTKLSTYDGVRWTLTPKVLINTATLDFGNTSAQNSADLTITVTGAADGDMVSLGVPNASTLTNSSFTAWVSATNTVTVRFNNYSSGSQDPASGTFKVQVFK